MESLPNDRFKTIVGVLIGVIALVTAVAAWRAGVASSMAGAEDYRAVVAVLSAQETHTLNYASVYAHLTAFTQFVINDELLTQLNRVPGNPARDLEIAQTDRLAATNRNFFPARYADKDGTYDAPRELAEQFAEAERQQDLSADAHLEQSAALDNKTYAFVQIIVGLSFALFFITFAGAVHRERKFIRYAAVGVGVLILFTAVVQIILVEFS